MSAVDINKDPLLERYHGARGFSTLANKLPPNRGAEVPNCDVRSHANLFSRSYKAERRLSYEPNSPEQFLVLLYGVHLCFVLFWEQDTRWIPESKPSGVKGEFTPSLPRKLPLRDLGAACFSWTAWEGGV